MLALDYDFKVTDSLNSSVNLLNICVT